MSEEATPPAVAEQAPVAVPTSLVGPDGSLVENWQTHAPEGYEDLREDKSLATQKNLWAMGKSFVHVRKQVPLDKMPRPNENFTDTDWEDYHKAGGRPDTVDDYEKMVKPDDWPEDLVSWDGADKEFRDTFHKIGLSTKQVKALTELNDRQRTALTDAVNQANETQQTQIKDGLHTLWGAAFDQNVHRGNIAMDKDADFVKDADYAERVKQKINADPDLVRHLSNIGANFIEHKIIEDPGISTPGDIQTQIDEIMHRPEYLKGDKMTRKRLGEQIMALRETYNKSIKTG